MTTSMELEQQLILRLDREAKKHWDEIITNMQEMAEDFTIGGIKEKSPLRNVLNVATEASSSLEVIKNFIRYQVGRQGSDNNIWKRKNKNRDKKLFADAVVEQIDKLREPTEKIVGAIALDLDKQLEDLGEGSKEKSRLSNLKKYLEKNRPTLLQSQHLKLTQLYLGYLSREHTARSANKN